MERVAAALRDGESRRVTASAWDAGPLHALLVTTSQTTSARGTNVNESRDPETQLVDPKLK